MNEPTLFDVRNELGLYSLAAHHVKGLQVLSLGAQTPYGLQYVLKQGAKSLHAIKAHIDVLQNPSTLKNSCKLEIWPEGVLPSYHPDATFDLIICQDHPLKLARDGLWATEFRRLLAPHGQLMLMVPNPQVKDLQANITTQPADEAALENMVSLFSLQFAHRHAFGQSPLQGTWLVDFAQLHKNDNLTFDRSMLSHADHTPQTLILLFSDQAITSRASLSITQLPDNLLTNQSSSSTVAELHRIRHDAAAYQSQIKDLLEELASVRDHEKNSQEQLSQLQNRFADTQDQLRLVQQQLQASQERHLQATLALQRAAALYDELESAKQMLQEVQDDNHDLRQQLQQAELPARTAVQSHRGTLKDKSKDGLGRPLDQAIEKLEDLLHDTDSTWTHLQK